MLDLRQPREALRERRRLRRCGDQVDVLHAVGHPPRRPGDLHVCAFATLFAQARGERLAQLDRLRQQQPPGGSIGRFGGDSIERGKHVFLELRAQAPDAAQPLRDRGLAQLLGRVDPELREQQPRALGPEAGQPCDRDQARRELRAHPLGRGRRAGVEQRDDLLLERRADPRAARSRARRVPAPRPIRRTRAPPSPRCDRRARGGRSPRRARTGRRAPPARRRSRCWRARRGPCRQGMRVASIVTARPDARCRRVGGMAGTELSGDEKARHHLGYASACPTSPG